MRIRRRPEAVMPMKLVIAEEARESVEAMLIERGMTMAEFIEEAAAAIERETGHPVSREFEWRNP